MAAPGTGRVSFGELLRQLRLGAGLTQEALAERSGLSVDAISALENGRRRRPRSDTVSLLAGALDLPPADRLSLESAAQAQGSPRGAGAGTPRSEVPRELPRPPADFTGRDGELELLVDARDEVVVSTIAGMGGVGKSALAIHAAHRLASDYGDGQLYVDLNGASPGLSPLPPLHALGHLLRSLGTRPADVPADVGEASARFRSLAADRRLLILLDDAESAEQVRPLLPGSQACLVIVTSRRPLTTLEAARTLHLDVLPHVDALDLLDRVAGGGRVAGEPLAASDVIDRCGRLPLAIRIAGARLAARPGSPIGELAGHLADAARRLQVLEAGDLSVRASFEVSLAALESSPDPIDRAAAAAFGRCGLPDGPDLGVTAAARLLDRDEPGTLSLLERLVDAQLLEAPASGRYRFHDLARLFAREHVARRLPADAQAEALERLFGFYTATAWATLRLLRPGDRRLATADPRWTTSGLPFPDATAAVGWLQAERLNLLAAASQSAEIVATGPARMPVELPGQLARALFGLLTLGHLDDLVHVNETALDVARRIHDRAGQAGALNDLGLAYVEMGRYGDAIACQERALDLFRELGDRHGQAGSLTNIGLAHELLGRPAEAIEQHRESLAIFRELGDRRGQASSSKNLGVASSRAGRDLEAVACLQASLVMFRELDARMGQAAVLHDLGLVYGRLARHEDAAACQRESLTIYRELDSKLGQAHSLMGLGVALAHLPRRADAIACLRDSLAIFRDVGARRDEAMVLRELGDVLRAEGAEMPARKAWRAALAISEQLRIPEADDIRTRLRRR
jgi:tetratricopeptide (TPR) repeat protein/transcriptional regulator with XRE-family HTH domain